MGLADIKDQLIDNVRSRWGDFQETEVYNRLKEKFEDLPAVGQKAVIWGSVTLVTLIIISIPWSWMDDASVRVDNFEEDKALVRDLLKVTRDLQQAPKVPKTITSTELKNRADEAISSMNLLGEQIVEVIEKTFPKNARSSFVPPIFEQKGVQVTLKKLNLKQVVDIAHRFQMIGRGSKVMSMDMTANRDDNHYYDSTFHLIAFSLPSQPEPAKKGRKKSRRRGRK